MVTSAVALCKRVGHEFEKARVLASLACAVERRPTCAPCPHVGALRPDRLLCLHTGVACLCVVLPLHHWDRTRWRSGASEMARGRRRLAGIGDHTRCEEAAVFVSEACARERWRQARDYGGDTISNEREHVAPLHRKRRCCVAAALPEVSTPLAFVLPISRIDVLKIGLNAHIVRATCIQAIARVALLVLATSQATSPPHVPVGSCVVLRLAIPSP